MDSPVLPYANGVHYDSEDRRSALVHRLVADGTLGTTHCTDDGVGMLYRGTEFVEAVSEQAGKAAYISLASIEQHQFARSRTWWWLRSGLCSVGGKSGRVDAGLKTG
jgi:hypothetical protein